MYGERERERGMNRQTDERTNRKTGSTQMERQTDVEGKGRDAAANE